MHLPSYETLLTCAAERAGPREPRQRSGSRVPALRRTPRPEARRNRQRHRARRGGRQRARTRERGSSRLARARPRRFSCRRWRRCCWCFDRAPRPGAAAGWRVAGNRQRAIQDYGQLIPRRRGVQPGGRDLPEHLQRRAIRRRLGVDVHAGMAGRLAEAPVLVHARLEPCRRRRGIRQHADQLPVPVAGSKAPDGRRFRPASASILPTGNSDELDSTGLQFNLPFSKQTGDVYWHWNAGLTWQPAGPTSEGGNRDIESPFLAGSAIVRLRPMLQRDAGDGGHLRRVADGGRHGARARRSRCRRDCAADGTSATSS